MAHQRTLSNVEGVSKEPHSISLKVLRLSRPSLSDQYPLPLSSSSISPSAALSYPSTSSSEKFILSPLLTLPPSFGSAYIGETFSCSLCANNELAAQDERFLSAVRIVAEMQTPTQTHVLELSPAESADVALRGVLGFGQSLQKIVRYELKEDGNHVLAVTVAYTERTPIEATTESAPGMVIDVDAPGNQRVRTFRKLYQFNVKQCLLVRTKAGEIQNRSSTKGAKAGEPAPLQYVLEAQLENVGEEPITLEVKLRLVITSKRPLILLQHNSNLGSGCRKLHWHRKRHFTPLPCGTYLALETNAADRQS
ncbi:MAG: hypothetical protein M1829_003770 [Trizodia sp. TS-e1964]|nr:MAG: hypothetical protein M1829_003770 [Trizodia sp. TS-e1964]